MVNYFKDKYLLPAPKILEDKITVDQKEAQIDVSGDPNRGFSFDEGPHYVAGTRVTYFLPFEGDRDLLKCQPSTFTLNPPRGVINENEIVLSYEVTNHDGETIKREFEQTFNSIKGYLTSIESGVAEFNNNIENNIRQRIESRKTKVMNDQGLIASLGFPMRKRENSIETYIAPQVKRKITPKMPDPSTVPFKPEPILEMEEYEHILKIISDMVLVMERSPKAFVNMDEETLRTQILVPLNGHYEGQATGETFNTSGKTDILIRVDDKNIFIAECKFWNGAENLKEAINQLLGYTAWRDTKTAILIFNRNKNLSEVLAKIPEAVKEHENYISQIQYDSETGFRFELHHKDDKDRKIILTILVFDIPSETT